MASLKAESSGLGRHVRAWKRARTDMGQWEQTPEARKQMVRGKEANNGLRLTGLSKIFTLCFTVISQC